MGDIADAMLDGDFCQVCGEPMDGRGFAQTCSGCKRREPVAIRPMKALTLWRPWTWAICHPSQYAKRVENRTWAPPSWMIGQDFAIHAGKRYDAKVCDWIADILAERPPAANACPQGIVAVAKLHRCIYDSGESACVATLKLCEKAGVGDWYSGPFGWLLDDVRVLAQPIACKGAQGLWELPKDVERAVRAALTPRCIGCNGPADILPDTYCMRCLQEADRRG